MKRTDFSYDLPEELIAQVPAQRRDASRLLVYDRADRSITDTVFSRVGDYLNAGDCLVLNSTKVIPARLLGEDERGREMEFLLLRRVDEHRWETMVRPGKRARVGARFRFGGGLLHARVDELLAGGNRLVTLDYEGEFYALLDRIGELPLPPYITSRASEKGRYQTVYARQEGSAAAPTAGLHFTHELLGELRQKGVDEQEILLHVGLGTFRPVKADDVADHVMHAEYYEVGEGAAQAMRRAKERGGRVVCVGTTSCRTVESIWGEDGPVAGSGMTDIFITPGYAFRGVDALITNFHLPESTLLMLVSAMMGREEALRVYAHAVRERYRFFSFGDAMLIV